MLNNREIIEMCEILAEQENLRVTISESLKCGLMAGFGAVAGGLLGGPVGVALGGSLASITSAWISKNKFRSVVDVLKHDMTPAHKRKLTEKISRVLTNVRPEDYVRLATIVLTSASLKEVVIKELCVFLLKEMNLNMVQ